MSKAARFSASILLTDAGAGRSVRERAERDVFVTVALFSATGLLTSVVAVLLGLDPIGF